MIVKLVAILLFVLWTFPFLVFFSSMRLLHPLLRKMGVSNNRLPTDWIHWMWAKCIFYIVCIEVTAEGTDKLGEFLKGRPTIGFFQHSSNLDAFIVMSQSPVHYKYIAKKSLQCVPFAGWMAVTLGTFIALDRTRVSDAIGALKKAAKVLKDTGRNIAISPEGTRSIFGQLREFKKGAFHLAYDTKAPITPMVIYGAYNLWPRGQVFPSPGTVVLRYLDPIQPEEYENLPIEEFITSVRTKMLNAMSDYPKNKPSKPSTRIKILHYISIITLYSITYFTISLIFF